MRRPWLAPVLLAGAGVVVHLPALWSSFLADDYVLLATIERVDSLAASFARDDGGGHFYRPLWIVANGLVEAVAGHGAWAFHALNLALFAAIVAEVWLLARRLLPPARAVVAAALFALYPRHGESVAWISGSTDLLATLFALGALLLVVYGRAPVLAPLLAAVAATGKEIAFVLPALALLVVWFLRRRGERVALWPVAAIAAAQGAVFVVRYAVMGGIGGYHEYPWGPVRAVIAAASYVAAALSSPQLDLLRHPVLVVVPAALALALGAAVWRTRRPEALLGLAWFALALVPSLNLVVDLDSSNGERLLFLPSVGLALAVAALAPLDARVLAPAAVALAALTLHAATSWVQAGAIADRVVERAFELGPRQGELLLLSVPESYRNARVLGLGLDAAVALRGLDRRTAWCAPVQVLEERAGSVRFRRAGDTFAGRTTWDAPFAFRLRARADERLTPDCTYRSVDRESLTRGLRVRVRPQPQAAPVAYAYFDGETLVPAD